MVLMVALEVPRVVALEVAMEVAVEVAKVALEVAARLTVVVIEDKPRRLHNEMLMPVVCSKITILTRFCDCCCRGCCFCGCCCCCGCYWCLLLVSKLLSLLSRPNTRQLKIRRALNRLCVRSVAAAAAATFTAAASAVGPPATTATARSVAPLAAIAATAAPPPAATAAMPPPTAAHGCRNTFYKGYVKPQHKQV